MVIDQYKRKTIEMAVARAEDKDAEINKLADGMGLPEKDVRKVWNEYVCEQTCKTNENTKIKKKPHQWTADEAKTIKEMYRELKSSTEIADALGLDREIVRAKIKELQRKGYLKTLSQIKAERMDEQCAPLQGGFEDKKMIADKQKKSFVNEEFEKAFEEMTAPKEEMAKRTDSQCAPLQVDGQQGEPVESIEIKLPKTWGSMKHTLINEWENEHKPQRNIDEFLETENMFNDIVKSFGGKVLMKGCDYTGTANIQFELDDGRQFKLQLEALSGNDYIGGDWDA